MCVVWCGVVCVVLQVERVVVTQLATAFEQATLSVGDTVHLVVQAGPKEGEAVLRLNITPAITDNHTLATDRIANFSLSDSLRANFDF